MARIVGVEIPNDKQVAYSLTYIYGIGLPTAKAVCAVAKVDETKRVKDLSEAELNAIRSEISKQRLQEIGSFRGMRHKRNLPCRGQRTKTNARTCKGPKKTVANKKKATM